MYFLIKNGEIIRQTIRVRVSYLCKNIDMLGIGLASTGLGLLGNIWAQGQASKATNDYNEYLQQSLKTQENTLAGRRTDLEQTFNRRFDQDYLDTETAKALQKRFASYSKDTIDSIRGQSVAAGATPEAVVAQQKTVGDQYNDLLGNIASQSTAYKQNLQNSRDMQKLGMFQLEDNLQAKKDQINANELGQRVNSANNLANNITTAASGITNAWADGAFEDWKK